MQREVDLQYLTESGERHTVSFWAQTLSTDGTVIVGVVSHDIPAFTGSRHLGDYKSLDDASRTIDALIAVLLDAGMVGTVVER